MTEQRRESTRALLTRLGLDAKKSLGQNFCQDDSLINAVMARLSLTAGDEVWEIGPGLGALSRALLATPVHLRLFEIDGRLTPYLEALCAVPRESGVPPAEIHWGDVLDVDLDALRALNSDRRLIVCGNLPYYCGTAIVRQLIEMSSPPAQLVFVLQREVVQKMAAGPGNDEYGFLSVAVQVLADVIEGPVFSPAAFFPNPAVTSGLVELRPFSLDTMARRQRNQATRIASIVFGQRRKMALNLLKKTLPAIPWAERFEKLGISPKARGEVIPVSHYLKLAEPAS
ncbi:MAG: 16S rRNA (adenine(1518)-N(6)/adenine(1519)-N(6))-dimethyltransferase RsmA [Candidatus Ozemobacteraceae bacterium]